MNIETQLKRSQSVIQDASDLLSILMGSSTGTVYTIDSIRITAVLIPDNAGLFSERSDFLALQKGMESYDLMINIKRVTCPGQLFASYHQ
jgi:hypothetical protein